MCQRSLMRVSLLAGVAASLACATTSTVLTEPAGAKVYLNGEYLGATPKMVASSYGFPKRWHVQVVAPGHKSVDTYLDARLSWPLGYLSYIFPPVLLAAWSLDSDYRFVLEPDTAATIP